jgi:hypothetical protein
MSSSARADLDHRLTPWLWLILGRGCDDISSIGKDELRKQMIGSVRRGRAFLLSLLMPLFCAAFLAAPFSATAAMAGAAPKELYNKSIDIYWGENTSNKRVADGVVVNSDGRIQRIIYISSAGRPFIRVSGGNNAASHTFEVAPNVAQGSTNFHGNQLVLTGHNMAVARQVTVTFDASFTSCTASVRAGKNGASPKWIGFDNNPYELLSISVGSASCSIKDGNAAAGH